MNKVKFVFLSASILLLSVIEGGASKRTHLPGEDIEDCKSNYDIFKNLNELLERIKLSSTNKNRIDELQEELRQIEDITIKGNVILNAPLRLFERVVLDMAVLAEMRRPDFKSSLDAHALHLEQNVLETYKTVKNRPLPSTLGEVLSQTKNYSDSVVKTFFKASLHKLLSKDKSEEDIKKIFCYHFGNPDAHLKCTYPINGIIQFLIGIYYQWRSLSLGKFIMNRGEIVLEFSPIDHQKVKHSEKGEKA